MVLISGSTGISEGTSHCSISPISAAVRLLTAERPSLVRDRWLGDDRPRYHTPPPLASRPPGIHSATEGKTTGHQGGYFRWPIDLPFRRPQGFALPCGRHRTGAVLPHYWSTSPPCRRYRSRTPPRRNERGGSESRSPPLSSPPFPIGVCFVRLRNRDRVWLPAGLAATADVESLRTEKRHENRDRHCRHDSPRFDWVRSCLLAVCERLDAGVIQQPPCHLHDQPLIIGQLPICKGVAVLRCARFEPSSAEGGVVYI